MARRGLRGGSLRAEWRARRGPEQPRQHLAGSAQSMSRSGTLGTTGQGGGLLAVLCFSLKAQHAHFQSALKMARRACHKLRTYTMPSVSWQWQDARLVWMAVFATCLAGWTAVVSQASPFDKVACLSSMA